MTIIIDKIILITPMIHINSKGILKSCVFSYISFKNEDPKNVANLPMPIGITIAIPKYFD